MNFIFSQNIVLQYKLVMKTADRIFLIDKSLTNDIDVRLQI